MRTVIRYFLAVASTVVIFPAVCFAQFGAIAGVVRDDTGAVLPGVTIEASSPALIEKVRTAVSDGTGQYRVEQLRPGSYTVTFTLTGFSTVRREGIEISAGFTAPVNIALKVGSVAETITVSGQAPVVDVQSSSQTKTLAKEAVDALPTARSYATLGTAIPGVTANQRDVGGSVGERGNTLSAHGSDGFDMTLFVDGVNVSWIGGTSGSAFYLFQFNEAATQEVVFETSALSLESSTGGVRVNVIPRQGGNTFSGSFFGNFATRGMSASNYTDALQAAGAAAPAGYNKLWDESGAFGGPLRQDRSWFFAAHRFRGSDVIGTNAFFSNDPLSWAYNADLSRPLHGGGWDLDNQLRVTTQVTQRDKVSIFLDKPSKCFCSTVNPSPAASAEAATQLTYPLIYLWAASWQSTISSKLLWDSSFSYNRQDTSADPTVAFTTDPPPISVLELSTSRRYRAPFTWNRSNQHNYNSRGALSYVTGAHAARVGFTLQSGHIDGFQRVFNSTDAMSFSFFNGVPQSITLTTNPYDTGQNINAALGLYGQDKWTLRRLTVTGGVRFDYFNTSIPAQSAAASRWVGARSFPEVPDVPNWKDISPRVGVAYDLFGNGKTAIKASVSRYVTGQVWNFAPSVNPFTTTVNAATRSWTDGLNGNPKDFIPQGDPLNPAPNGEFLGTIDPNFGKSFVTTRYDADVSQGWGKRPYNWEYMASVQHELVPRVSLEVAYFHRKFSNQTVTDNLDITPADFDQFCITAPTDSRLGSVSGSQQCGIYDFKPGKQLLTSNKLITFAKNFPGETSQSFDGVDASVNARPNARLFLQAGYSTGRSVNRQCALVDDPTTTRNCDLTPPFLGSYRLSGAYTFPWDLQVSAVFQSTPPTPQYVGGGNFGTGFIALADFQVRNTTPGITLGRPIVTPGGVITTRLLDPATYTDYGDRTNQLDLRVSKGVRVGRYKFDAIADVYNVFNSSAVQNYVTTYGPAWLTPSLVLQSLFVKLGGRFTF